MKVNAASGILECKTGPQLENEDFPDPFEFLSLFCNV
jgi:hypothetical protein